MINPTPIKRAIFFALADIVVSLFTLFLSYNLRFNFEIDNIFLDNFFVVFTLLVLLKFIFIYYFNIYNVAWRFFSLSEAKKLLYAHILAYCLFVVIYYLYPENFNPFPRSVIIIDLFLSFIFIGAFRLSKRLILEGSNDKSLKKTLIIGVSSISQSLLKEQNSFYISSIVDDNKMISNSYVSNIKVKTFEDIDKILHEDKIESIIIAKQLEQKVLQKLYKKFKNYNIFDIHIVDFNKIKPTLETLTVEDLLARHPKDLDTKKIESFIKEKVVLITGAGGSIGSEISRQCKKFGASKLILLDHSEFNLYSITDELKTTSDTEIVSVMQTVRNIEYLDSTFSKYKPQIVIHAAAYKHVPLVEDNILEGISNNIMGTKNCIDVAIRHNVEKFVLISTDKAVRPTNVMGTTKRICELYAQNVDAQNTEIVSVRFGNVLGSSGSVIPKFKSQIEQGKNITVTHPDITRYFMLIPEACELVLQAGAIANGGEIFILDMGEPIKIVDLAQKMIDLSGRDDIGIEFCGLRPGEKLYEELLINDTDKKTQYESITVASSTYFDIDNLNKKIMELLTCKDKIAKLQEIVPEFDHKLNNVKEKDKDK